MTSSSRQGHIDEALAEHRAKPAGTGETARVPLRGGSALLEVIDLPLDVPILNADSFRIAPALADHPDRQIVLDDPESQQAQAIVSDLVRSSHRNIVALKESLLLDGQDNPGVVTRAGKLVNANTRCVLLRDLVAEGRLASAALRVAVLPPDLTNSEELGLESVLQQQQEFKDEYTLVSKLMMIETLHTKGGMTDRQIATSLREKKGPSLISDLREVLVLMNRARHLTTEPRPLSAFVTKKDQQENWLELLRLVRDIDRLHGREAGNDYIRTWLVAFYSGFDSVHQLRNVRGDWIQRDVLPILREGDSTALQIAAAAETTPKPDRSETASDDSDRQTRAVELGLDLLAEDTDTRTEQPVQGDPAIQTLLDVVAATRAHPETDIELTPGVQLDPETALAAIRQGVDEGIRAVRRRNAGANKLGRPQNNTLNAVGSLRAAAEALQEVQDEPEFAPLLPDLIEAVTETQEALDALKALLTQAETPDE